MPAGGDDTARERLLELRPRRARVAPDEDASVVADPQRRSLPETLDELRRHELADDTANAVQIPSHGGETYFLAKARLVKRSF